MSSAGVITLSVSFFLIFIYCEKLKPKRVFSASKKPTELTSYQILTKR